MKPDLLKSARAFGAKLAPIIEEIKNEDKELIRQTVIELTFDKTISASDEYRKKTAFLMKKCKDPLVFSYNILMSASGNEVL